ncbi:MAG: hypothetical protein ACNA8W_23680 [Bradymonadaceae bacterium]
MRPVPVTALNDVAAMAADTYNTCARLNDGTVHCWGENQRLPAPVPGLTDVTGITVGIELLANPWMVIDGSLQPVPDRLFDRYTPLIGFHLTIGFHHTFRRSVNRSGSGPSAQPEQTPEPRGPSEDVRSQEEPEKDATEPQPPVFDHDSVPLY